MADADALLVRSATKVDARLLAAAPRLRIVARAGTGVDNVDVAAATDRGIVVVNAPGANSISVAEHALALMLSLARSVPAADRAMKDEQWEKRRFLGTELRGKTLGVAGLGRIGQEVAHRARAFGMRVVAHDPFISAEVATGLGVELLVARRDVRDGRLRDAAPAVDARNAPHLQRRALLALQARAADHQHGARRPDRSGGPAPGHRRPESSRPPALDVFETEPPKDWALAKLPQVVATPHIAASTEEAQELVGLETAAAVRDFLREGIVRNAVNFPSLAPDVFQRLQPWIRLADRLGALVSQMGTARIEAIGIRYYGVLADSATSNVLASSVAAGVLRPILSGGVSLVNATAAARDRGIEIVESRSSRARHFTSLVSVKLHTSDGERWVEGTIFEPATPRLVSVRGVEVEAPLAGTLLVLSNDDRPGVIGDVGTILGRHGVNIANFALGRGAPRRHRDRERGRRRVERIRARRRRRGDPPPARRPRSPRRPPGRVTTWA